MEVWKRAPIWTKALHQIHTHLLVESQPKLNIAGRNFSDSFHMTKSSLIGENGLVIDEDALAMFFVDSSSRQECRAVDD